MTEREESIEHKTDVPVWEWYKSLPATIFVIAVWILTMTFIIWILK